MTTTTSAASRASRFGFMLGKALPLALMIWAAFETDGALRIALIVWVAFVLLIHLAKGEMA